LGGVSIVLRIFDKGGSEGLRKIQLGIIVNGLRVRPLELLSKMSRHGDVEGLSLVLGRSQEVVGLVGVEGRARLEPTLGGRVHFDGYWYGVRLRYRYGYCDRLGDSDHFDWVSFPDPSVQVARYRPVHPTLFHQAARSRTTSQQVNTLHRTDANTN
jgi:hypothetical protein